jgi:hypothetical protein
MLEPGQKSERLLLLQVAASEVQQGAARAARFSEA